MDASLLLRLLLFVCLLCLSAFFSSCETALFSLRRPYREKLSTEQAVSSQLIAAFLKQPRRLIITLLLGNDLINVILGVTGASIVLRLLGTASNLLAIIGTTAVLLLAGEILPKSLALRHAPSYAHRIALPLEFVARTLFPLRWMVRHLVDALLRALGSSAPPTEASSIPEDEFRALLAAGEDAGIFQETERAMIRKALVFSGITVSQVMTPRTDIEGVKVTSSLDEVMAAVQEGHFSRMPAYEETIDQVVGILYAKDILRWRLRDQTLPEQAVDLRALLREPYFVPEGKLISELMAEFQRRKVHLAVVLDEYGGVAGLVTMEDLLEELVGEISDEFDEPAPPSPPSQQLSATPYRLSAMLPVTDASKLLHSTLPHGDYDTLGGFILHLFGRLPQCGESVASDGLTFTIDKMRGTRILEISVERRTD